MNRGFTIVEILIAAFIIILISVGGFVVYTKNSTDTLEENIAALEGDIAPEDAVNNTQDNSAFIQTDNIVAKSTEIPAAQETEPAPATEPVPESEPEPTLEPTPEPEPEPPPPAPACTLNISPGAITKGENATLSWSSSNADSANMDQGIGTLMPVASGSKSVSPTVSTTYTATFTGGGGTIMCNTAITVNTPPPSSPQTVTVTYTNNGFSSKTATINQGDTVLFVNNSTHGMWVSSNVHPTHTQYPESTSGDCLGSSFDACTNIASGNSWSFTFNSIGSWGYHNHIRVGKTGTVIVQ